MSPTDDRVVSAITSDFGFRVFAARTTMTVRDILAAQKVSGTTGRHLGDLLSAAILLRTTMAPGLRVQCIVRGAGGQGTLVADSHPSGATRGLYQRARTGVELRLDGDAVLQAMRTLHDGRIHQGLVQVPRSGCLADAFMTYLQQSEQSTTMAGLVTLLDGEAVTGAAGYLVQMVPDAPYQALESVTEQLERLGDLNPRVADPEFGADDLLAEVLGNIPHERREQTAVRYQCWCSEVRVVSALARIDRSELEGLLQKGTPVEVSCDYCGAEYRIATARLRGLLAQS